MTKKPSNATGAGYSGTPLLKKLGIKPGMNGAFLSLPEDAPIELSTFDEWGEIQFASDVSTIPTERDFIHLFEKNLDQFLAILPEVKLRLKSNGMIWVSWPKKASKVPSTMNEDLIRKSAIENGLVDIKVCAVDTVWSGLKLVIPVKYR
ncbi:MAG: hypothetical protein ABJN26_28770 [Stappiaceae bacterium]